MSKYPYFEHKERIAALAEARRKTHHTVEHRDADGKLWKVTWEPKA